MMEGSLPRVRNVSKICLCRTNDAIFSAYSTELCTALVFIFRVVVRGNLLHVADQSLDVKAYRRHLIYNVSVETSGCVGSRVSGQDV